MALTEEISRKLYLLKKHFGIQAGPPGDRDLAACLAIKFVPGFQIEAPVKSRGRPRSKWTHGQYLGLLFDVERIKEDLGAASDIAALEALVISPNDYFSDKPPRSESLRDQRARSLNSRLTEGRRLVEKQEVQFLFAPEKRELMRRVFAHGSPVRRCNFY